MKGKALRKHSLLEKTAASVLLKPFTCHTVDVYENQGLTIVLSTSIKVQYRNITSVGHQLLK